MMRSSNVSLAISHTSYHVPGRTPKVRWTVEPMGSKGTPAAAVRERAARVIPRTWLVEV